MHNNTRLPGVLAAFSATLPPPNASPSDPDTQVWTLDELFLLPIRRLKYFKKLYGRLLKGAQPGRNNYRFLVGATEMLDNLLAILDVRANIKAGSQTPATPETEDEVVVDFRKATNISNTQEFPPVDTTTGSETSSARGSGLSSKCVSVYSRWGFVIYNLLSARSSNDTSLSSTEPGSAGELSIPLADLESRLAVERCLDIFTMKLRVNY